MRTEIWIVIESFFLLYMLATSGTGFATVKARQNKNPRPCRGHRGRAIALRRSSLLRALGFAGRKTAWVAGVVERLTWMMKSLG
jgi:hypothetical protein